MNNITTGRQQTYETLPESELCKGFCRPVRRKYVHDRCGQITEISLACAETFAAQPKFYTHGYCEFCREHFPVAEFEWLFWRGKLQGRVGT